MAEPEIEAAWRAEFKRIGEKEIRYASNGDDSYTDELKKEPTFHWLGDEAEVQRLHEGHTYHYVRWTFFVALAAAIAGLIAVGLALLR